MALTINTHPTEVITNAPEFNVTTDLTEDADHQNLRIRATIYQGGEAEAVAVLEQPKNLDDWNLFDVLKDLIGKCNVAVGGSSYFERPTIASEALTAWSNFGGLFETFTTSVRELTSVIDSNASGGVAASNDLGAGSAGDIFIIGLENDYNDSGAADFVLKLVDALGGNVLSEAKYAGLSSDKLIANHIYIMHMPAAEAASYIILETVAGANAALTGTLTIHKIADFKNNPGVYFHVKFEEVYEDASNVTQIGAESWSDTLLFVPVSVRPGEAFDDYLIDQTSKKFISRAEDGAALFKYGIDMEIRLLAISVATYAKITLTTDAGATSSTKANTGWLIAILNDNVGSIDAEDETAQIQMLSADRTGSADHYTGADVIISTELKCFPDMSAFSFVGALGEETILFRGLPSEEGGAEKSFIKDPNRIRKVLKAYKRTGEVLRTLFETEEVRRLLHELVYTELPVWMYNEDFTDGYREVTVLNDDTPIKNQKQLIESEIEVEYYE